jgi:hypothetical protein
MSTEIEITHPNDAETDDAVATLEESEAPIDLGDDSDHEERPIDAEDSEEVDTSMGEWSLCASMIFLAGYLVIALCSFLGPDLIDVTVATDFVDEKEVVRCKDGDIFTIGATKFEIDLDKGFTAGNVQVIVQTGDTSLDIAKAITEAIKSVGAENIREVTASRMPLSWVPLTKHVGSVVRIDCASPVTFTDNSNKSFSVASGSILPRSLVYLDEKDMQKRGYRTRFPVGVATILLLISLLSAFCALMSLVADKNNRRTLLVRLVTLGPLLPTAMAGFMIWVIIKRGAGNSILENFLG